MFYTRAIDPEGAHVVEQALSIASAVAGQPLEYVEPPFPLDPAHEAWADDLIANLDRKPVAIMNPGAGWGAKCWPAESFGIVARALASADWRWWSTTARGKSSSPRRFARRAADVAVPLKCSVGELIALTRRA